MLFPMGSQIGPPADLCGLGEVDLGVSPCLVMDRGIAFLNAAFYVAVPSTRNIMITGL
jgi:hypothetical protein